MATKWRKDLHKSAGILEDYSTRKFVATREGTITKAPSHNNDIVNKKYVNDTVGDYVLKAGDTMTGALTVEINSGSVELLKLKRNASFYLDFKAPAGADPIISEVETSGTNSMRYYYSGTGFNAGDVGFFQDVYVDGDMIVTGNVEGVNVTSGADPGHTHTAYATIDGLWEVSSGHTQLITDDTIMISPSSNNKLYFRDTGIFIHSNADGELTMEADVKVTIGVAGDTVLGDATERDMYPQTDLKINLGTSTHSFNDFFVGGDIIMTDDGGGLCFGACSMYDGNWSQANAVQNTWYNVSDVDAIDGELHLVTHDGSGELTATNAGKYLCTVSCDVECSAGNKHVEIGFEVNGTGSAQTAGIVCQEINTANEEHNMSATAILDLSGSKTIELCIRTTDVGTPTLSVDCINLNIVQIGG